VAAALLGLLPAVLQGGALEHGWMSELAAGLAPVLLCLQRRCRVGLQLGGAAAAAAAAARWLAPGEAARAGAPLLGEAEPREQTRLVQVVVPCRRQLPAAARSPRRRRRPLPPLVPLPAAVLLPPAAERAAGSCQPRCTPTGPGRMLQPPLPGCTAAAAAPAAAAALPGPAAARRRPPAAAGSEPSGPAAGRRGARRPGP
jgi:hypothetical protein